MIGKTRIVQIINERRTAVAPLTEALVRECPSVSVLATSRQALAISGESTFRIPSLPVPAVTEGLRASDAVVQSNYLLNDARK